MKKWMQRGLVLAMCLGLTAGVAAAVTAAPPMPDDDKPKAEKEAEHKNSEDKKTEHKKGEDTKKGESKKAEHKHKEGEHHKKKGERKKTDEQKKGEAKEPETITRQSTPVLGVMVGKPMGVEGAEVIRVWPESPAEKAGLQEGDLIVKFKNRRVKSPEALRAAVVKQAPGDRIAMVVERDGEEKKIKTRLGGADDFGRARQQPEARRALKPRAWLGVRMLPESVRGPGVSIEAVVPGSPADEAGLEAGDRILQVDKTRVEAIADLQTQIAGRSPGDVVRLVVRRNDTRQDIEVELGAFAGWRGDISDLSEPQVRQLLEEFMRDAFEMPQEATPEEEADKPKARAKQSEKEHEESKAKERQSNK